MGGKAETSRRRKKAFFGFIKGVPARQEGGRQ